MRTGIFTRAAAASLLLWTSANAAPSIFDDPASTPAKTPNPPPRTEAPQPAAPAPDAGPAEKSPIPDAATLKQASASIDRVYAADLAKAKTPEQKQDVIEKIWDTNPKGSDDAPARYVLLCRVRDLAAEIGDSTDALAAADELEQSYAIDGPAMRADLLVRISKTVREKDDMNVLFQSALQQIDLAIDRDEYGSALRIADIAEMLANKVGSPEMVRMAALRAREQKEVSAAFAAVKRPVSELAKNPASPDANLAAGRFYCFAKGDWARGLALLAKSSDRTLAAQSSKEMQSAPPPPLELADGWTAAMARGTTSVRGAIAIHALALYRQALPSLSPAEKLRVQRKMEDLREAAKQAPLRLRRNADIGSNGATAAAGG